MTLRVVFIGASHFGLKCLKKLEQISNCEVVGIVTAPQKFAISYRPSGVTNVLHADIETYARSQGLPFRMLTGKMTDPEILDDVRRWRPDLMVVVGWYHMVPKAMREISRTIGMHASLLPDYAGGAPLVWAIINGEKQTGITLFEFADGVDDGLVLAQTAEPILERDTIATLYARIEDRGLELLQGQIPLIARGADKMFEQDVSKRRVFPQRSPEDGHIDWNWPARRIYDFVRAQTRPYPGAFSFFRGRRITLWSVEVIEGGKVGDRSVGSILLDSTLKYAIVVCGDNGRVLLREVELDGAIFSGDVFYGQIVGEGNEVVAKLG